MLVINDGGMIGGGQASGWWEDYEHLGWGLGFAVGYRELVGCRAAGMAQGPRLRPA